MSVIGKPIDEMIMLSKALLRFIHLQNKACYYTCMLHYYIYYSNKETSKKRGRVSALLGPHQHALVRM